MTCMHCGGSTKCKYSRAMDGAKPENIPAKHRPLLGAQGRWRRYTCHDCGQDTDTSELPIELVAEDT